MTIVKHELRRGKMPLLIWTLAIAFMMAVAVVLYPEMKGEMEQATNMFADMGAMTDAFGMDKIDFGTFKGYYAIECGNVLGMGASFFAALIAASALSKEEKDRTAEFLLTHPVTRTRVVAGKLAAVAVQIVVLNAAIFAVALVATLAIGESVPWTEIGLLHLAYLLLQIVLAGICFGISAFIRKGGAGIGIGIAAAAYFLNIIANITESARFLKYVTPWGFCDGSDIAANASLEWGKVAIGLALCALCVAAAFVKYRKKDIR